MREVVVVGRPNSGKTLFALNFAGFLGSRQVDVIFRDDADTLTCRNYGIDEAKRQLCSSSAHQTLTLQSIALRMTVGKTPLEFMINDTCGVSEQIHPEAAVRRGMAQTLKCLRHADYIFHMVDMLYWSNQPIAQNGNIDQEIYRYGLARNAYTILANKVDKPLAREQLAKISSAFPKARVIPISALLGTGFKEVKACVARNI
ncbi:MAG: GTPase domain-containing protein [Sporomusaceae bacterium]|nr:GTPase domain-containing protein [Sporomusaceae bacterium]